jgi:DMSO/TMAO reductase YedYZ molybdopterin-dependent catalytic subunit
MPEREDWKRLAATGFHDYRLKIGGLVEQPVELSLLELKALGKAKFIIMHHCIHGNSAVDRSSHENLMDLVRPKPSAKAVAFFSFGGSLYGGGYHNTQSLQNVLKPECLLWK